MIGARIAALRRQRSWSQGELAQQLNISPSAIGMYEQGRREPSLETAARLAKVFSVSLDYLITGVPGETERQGLEDMVRDRILAAEARLDLQETSALSRRELAVLFTALLIDKL